MTALAIIGSMLILWAQEHSKDETIIAFVEIKDDVTIRTGGNAYLGYRASVGVSTPDSRLEGREINLLWSDLSSAFTPYRRASPDIGRHYVVFLRRINVSNIPTYELESSSLAFDKEMFDWTPALNVARVLREEPGTEVVVAGTILESKLKDEKGEVLVEIETIYRYERGGDFPLTPDSLATMEVTWFRGGAMPYTGERYILFLRHYSKNGQFEREVLHVLAQGDFAWPPTKAQLEKICVYSDREED